MQANLEIHPEYHQEFHLAKNTDSSGCCCFWKSKSKPKEFFVKEDGTLTAFKSTTRNVHNRIIANKRLAKLVESKFEENPIEANKAFDILREKINYSFDGSKKITEDCLINIVNAIYEIRKELKVKKLHE